MLGLFDSIVSSNFRRKQTHFRIGCEKDLRFHLECANAQRYALRNGGSYSEVDLAYKNAVYQKAIKTQVATTLRFFSVIKEEKFYEFPIEMKSLLQKCATYQAVKMMNA